MSRYYLALFAVTLLSLASGGRYAFAQSLKTHLPVVDYAAESQTENSGTASACYNRPGSQPIVELPAGTDELPINAHWWVGLPALPVEQSDAVVIGEVERAQAHLSTDKTGVHSEFTIRLEDVLKGRSEEAAPGGTLIAERFGGAVRFPSGKIQYYRLARQGAPRVNTRYVLFLKGCGGSRFSLLTAYALRAGRVVPLDGRDNRDDRARLPFASYEDVEVGPFLRDLRHLLAGQTVELSTKE